MQISRWDAQERAGLRERSEKLALARWPRANPNHRERRSITPDWKWPGPIWPELTDGARQSALKEQLPVPQWPVRTPKSQRCS
ncbi:hypothetical protein EMEDMD4_10118 [Sinorhizobium medicae]|uniref:Uncharacterized protein n=1 Tax=Sinorhizobium medicae TaxID=110321 RepID=A0A508WNK0_9HYPH|nr:hypothetical protein EMEDMD4_10118 [Sinorhizobium medicae]